MVAGFYDMQCVPADHPMRDVAYHLMISTDASQLARREEAYVAHYVSALNALRPDCELTFDEAWVEYRLHALFALSTCIICAGTSDLILGKVMATLTLGRVCAAMDRVDSRGALELVLAKRKT